VRLWVLVGLTTSVVALTATAAEPPRFARVQRIFDDNCVVCHQTGAESQGVNLEADKSLASLVGQRSAEAPMLRVDPGQPGSSYLIAKLEGRHLQVGGTGERMPVGGALSEADVAAIRAWISAGAKP
jgi:mono/diheme cytochrome c family protein